MSVEYLAELDVSNVYIYVGDAVRYDYVPESVHTRGVSIRTIAASTHSPTSFASLVTGRYPPRHGVETFTNRLDTGIARLFDILDIETGFINSIFAFAIREHTGSQDPIYSVLNLDQSKSLELSTVSSPFVLMERGPGGHAPYGDFDDTASQYFSDRAGADTSTLQSDYARSIERDADLFEQRIETLRDRGLLDDTLVIYTSDHGEMLGENGLLGHNAPMRPELVYVPTVFAHPELPAVQEHEVSIHHVDILPTVCDLLDRAEEYIPEMDGSSVLSATADEPRPCFWSNTFLPDSIPILSGRMNYSGAWDSDGGHVFTGTRLPDRMSVLGGKLIRSSKRSYMRRHLGACLRAYLRGDTTYRNPDFSRGNAKRVLESASEDPANSVETTLSNDGRRQLENLGYLE